MLNYILRRLLLIIPTLIGITLIVFLILACAPGGIGANLSAGASGEMSRSNSLAIARARMEDRYGLNEPVFVQYWRWLCRISPVKIGQRDLIGTSGELVTRPRPVLPPVAWQWFIAKLPSVSAPDQAAIQSRFPKDDQELRAIEFQKVNHEYAGARSIFTINDTNLREAIRRYIEANVDRRERSHYMSREKVFASRLPDLKVNRDSKEFKEIEKYAQPTIDAWKTAEEARLYLIRAMATKPYPEAGFGISGVISIAWPDMGMAYSRGGGQRVIDLIATHLPVTLLLNFIAFPIFYLIAIPSGMLAAIKRGSIYDVGLGGLYIALFSVPVVLAGVLALGFLATPEYLNLFPTAKLHDKNAEDFLFLPTLTSGYARGYILDTLWHLVLPVFCLVYGGFAVLSKQTRAAMLENLNADYVRTAKAKGVANKDVIFVHVLRNSLLPLITMFVSIFPAMLSGSVVIERIFSIEGMGYLLLDAIQLRDRELILANTTMVAVVNLVSLLLADILYAIADPRIAYK